MKGKIGELIKKTDFIVILMALIPFLFGTFHDFSVFIVALIFQIIIISLYIKNKKITINVNYGLILSVILFIFSILSIIWAIDRNDATVGVLRYLSIIIFNIFLMQVSNTEKEKITNIIPYSALLMLIISIIIGFIPACKDFVYTPAGNLMGFFPYANTFALYLLLGIIILSNKEINKYSLIISLILSIGIYLTGSKTTLILFVLYLIYFSLNKQNAKAKYYIITYVSIFVLAIALIFILNRIKIIDVYSNFGTLLERLLYWKDSLKIILQKPFGLRLYGLLI